MLKNFSKQRSKRERLKKLEPVNFIDLLSAVDSNNFDELERMLSADFDVDQNVLGKDII